ncbi:MAG: hypothetical protein EZS28_000539 [Streblomastix strix]|uniref:Uncharacterized protein n=1 Tax=Streblomastix strix TaxID=222440 RepID=A0A5J4XAU4_9EUKA|nr:MAG: hypothetical protein EZS28_000539 [Streblomastix strix]
MGEIQKQRIVDKIRATDPGFAPHEVLVGVIGQTSKTMNRQSYSQYFGEDLRSEFLENAMMLNNEGKLVTEKCIKNSQRYAYNPNAKFAEPSIYLGHFSPVLSLEYINNEIKYSDRGQSSILEDIQPTMQLMQEKLIEKQQQAIEKELVSQENLAQIYDVGALDCGRRPVNDLFNRKQFKTQKTGWWMNADGSISAVVKKENTKITPEEKKPKNKKELYSNKFITIIFKEIIQHQEKETRQKK